MLTSHKSPLICTNCVSLPCCVSFFPVLRWETLDSFMQHDVQELCRVVSSLVKNVGVFYVRVHAE